jgi:ribosomal protein L31
MKKKELPVYKTRFCCISCQQVYETISISSNDVKISACKNCVYPGASVSKVRMGNVERFYEKMKKIEEKKQVQ